MAKQFYFAHDLEKQRTNFSRYHTHITCPSFSGSIIPRETTQGAIILIPKCESCSKIDKSHLNIK